jgi:hypothetical protein
MPPYHNDIFDESEGADCTPLRPIRRKGTLSPEKAVVEKRLRINLAANVVHPIPHMKDLTDEEVTDVWYGKQDYVEIKKNMVPFLRRMTKGEKVIENDRHSTRGLEFRIREGAIKRMNNKREAAHRVLDEQERQIELFGYTNAEIIAKVYRVVNCHCAVEAHQLALRDVQHAREHCADATAEHIRLSYLQKDDEKKNGMKTAGMMGRRVMRQMRFRKAGSTPLTDSTNAAPNNSRNRDEPRQIALANYAA